MNPLSYEGLRNEEKLLLLTSRKELTPSIEEEIASILQEGFHVGRYTSLAVKHKVLQLSSRHLIRLDRNDAIDVQYKRLFEYSYLGNAEKNKYLFNELQYIMNRFYEAGLKVVPVKGSVLTPSVYGDYGIRTLNDLDFIIHLHDRSAVSDVLIKEGYQIGDYDWSSDEIITATNQEAVFWKMNAGNLHPHVKKIDNPFIKCVRVDFSYDVDLQKNYTATKILLEDTVLDELLGSPAYTLSPLDFLLHISIHLYKEASNVRWVELGAELSLIKFCDFREFLLSVSTQLDWEVVFERACELHAVTAMYYSLFFTNLLYQENHGTEFFEYARDINIEEVDQFGKADYGSSIKWNKTFMARFFSDSNEDELIEQSKLHSYK